jgi:hypothetical protein
VEIIVVRQSVIGPVAPEKMEVPEKSVQGIPTLPADRLL